MRNLLIGLILISSIFACNSDQVIFRQVDEVPNARWSYGDVYDYSFNVEDTTQVYRLLLYLEFSTDYSWENLYTEITTTYPGDSTRTDVVSLELASSTGVWYGDCNAKRCELNIPLQENVKFPMPGEYQIAFEQYMREEIIEGVQAIGLKLIIPNT